MAQSTPGPVAQILVGDNMLHSTTKIAMTSHRRSLSSGEPGSPERVGLLEGDASAEKVLVAYHARTKRHVHRYAATLGYMCQLSTQMSFQTKTFTKNFSFLT